jgi:hypothetical protein
MQGVLQCPRCASWLTGAVGCCCLCGLQASIWDVDGTGMQQVPGADLDLAIRKVSWRWEMGDRR